MRMVNTGYGRSRTIAKVYDDYAAGVVSRHAVVEKLHHTPKIDLSLALHGVTILRTTHHSLAGVIDSIVNTIRHDLRGHRAVLTREVDGSHWSIGYVEDVAPYNILNDIVEEMEAIRNSFPNHYDARAITELMQLFRHIKQGRHYLTMQHMHLASGLPLTAIWMTSRPEDATSIMYVVSLVQREHTNRVIAA